MVDEKEQPPVDLVYAAAVRGVHQAQVIYGQMLLDGVNVKCDQFSAFHWFERAAHGGNLMAINMVGRCLDQGWGVAPSKVLAEKWFRKAAERGLDWGMYNLATLLTLGEDGIQQNKFEAFHWLRQAADLGHIKSLNLLAGFYEDGWVVHQDLSTARNLYYRAAIGGDFRGQFNYARLLLQEGDLLGSLHWFQQVPHTATSSFIQKMSQYLSQQPQDEIRHFVTTLTPYSIKFQSR